MTYKNQGVFPVRPDHRDFSFHRTFGTTDTFTPDFHTEAGLTNPSQNQDGLPNGCTGYTQSELCQDEDKRVYLPRFTYDKTLMMEGAPEGVGCDVRDSLKSTIVYGVQALGESPATALNYRRGAYYAVEQSHGDWFDSIRSVMSVNNRSVSIATHWYPIWSQTGTDGIITAPSSYQPPFSLHNFKLCGWTTINGVVYLIAKPWIGSFWADHGFCYFPREVINQLMDMPESGAFTLAPFTGQTVQTVQITILEIIASYCRMILKILKTP